MLKNTLSLLAGALMVATITSCSEYDKTEEGLEYKILKDSAGENYPEEGGAIIFWFQIRSDKDSVLDNQFKDPYPVQTLLPPVTYHPSIEEGFRLLTEGDSAVFLLSADSLYKKTFQQPQLPAFIKPGSMVRMSIKMVKVYSKKQVDSLRTAQQTQMDAQVASDHDTYEKDSIAIQDYLKKHNLKGQSTIGGVYVVKLKENKSTDIFIGPGDSVKTSYIGSLLVEGTEFDRSKPGDYFTFTIGSGMVIKGWDQGFQKLKKGEKALILIPSNLAYGPEGRGPVIAPNAPLLFEVEVQK